MVHIQNYGPEYMDHWPVALVHILWSIILYMDLQTFIIGQLGNWPNLAGNLNRKSLLHAFEFFRMLCNTHVLHTLRMSIEIDYEDNGEW